MEFVDRPQSRVVCGTDEKEGRSTSGKWSARCGNAKLVEMISESKVQSELNICLGENWRRVFFLILIFFKQFPAIIAKATNLNMTRCAYNKYVNM